MKKVLIIGCGLLGSSLLRRISKKKRGDYSGRARCSNRETSNSLVPVASILGAGGLFPIVTTRRLRCSGTTDTKMATDKMLNEASC